MTVPPLCDIVIPIWNQLDLTRRCLESIVRSTPQPVRLILVDNGSAEPTQQFLEQFRAQGQLPVQLIRHESNRGFIKAVNRGIRASQTEWVCLLNNDTVVTSGWLAEMIQVAQNDPAIGLVNPTSNSLGFPAGKTSLEQMAEKLKTQTGQVKELVTALGFCLLARRSLFEKIGLLDESFGMGNFDDDDLSRRAKQAGFRCVMACGSYVFHEEKASFRSLPDWEREFDRNRERYEKRWGRSIRIFWVNAIPPAGGANATVQTALQLTGQGHWICFVDPTHQLPQTLLSSTQVSEFKPKSPHWRLRALIRLLAKRKKPFDLVISDDPTWSRWVRRLGWLHHAEALEHPSSKEIVERCQTLSRFPSWSALEETRPFPTATPLPLSVGSALEETRPLPTAAPLPLSVVVITKNEQDRLQACLESVAWAGEIIVVDDESTDETCAIARKFTDRVIVRKMEIEGTHRNFAYALAKYDWVFSLDADERITPELAQEIQTLLSQQPPFDIYAVPRKNYIGRTWIRHGGWYPSPQVKLFRKNIFRWEETTVHPRAISDRPWGVLKSDLIHFSYRDLADFVGKLNRQTTLEAQKWILDQRRMGLGKALWRTLDRFWRAYVGKKGHRDGEWGLIVAVMAGAYQLVSYAKYWQHKLSTDN